jgi:hypothetical protein
MLKTLNMDDYGGLPEGNLDSRDNRRICSSTILWSAFQKISKIFTSQTELIGMGPPHVQLGDISYVLFGATVPFLL